MANWLTTSDGSVTNEMALKAGSLKGTMRADSLLGPVGFLFFILSCLLSHFFFSLLAARQPCVRTEQRREAQTQGSACAPPGRGGGYTHNSSSTRKEQEGEREKKSRERQQEMTLSH